MKKIISLCLLLFALCNSSLFAQVKSNIQNPTSINDSGLLPDNSAILDLQSNDKGLLIPRHTKYRYYFKRNGKQS